MPLNLDAATNTLGDLLPFLAKEKAQRDQLQLYLQNALTEIEARKNAEAENQNLMARNRMAEILGTNVSDYFRDVPGGAYSLPGYLKSILPTFTAGVQVPPENAGIANDITKNITDMYNSAQNLTPISPDVLKAVVGRVATRIPLDLITNLPKDIAQKNAQALTASQQGIEKGNQALKSQELGLEAQKLGLAKATALGKTPADITSTLKEAQNDRESAILKYAGVGSLFSQTPEAQKALTASIKNANSRIDVGYKKLGQESPIPTQDEMFKVGVAILQRAVTTGELPNWNNLLYQGYDPDFVFGLQRTLEKPNAQGKAPLTQDSLKKAMALLQSLSGQQ